MTKKNNVCSTAYCALISRVKLVRSTSKALGLGTHLFFMVPRPGDREVTFSVFESSKNQAEFIWCEALALDIHKKKGLSALNLYRKTKN